MTPSQVLAQLDSASRDIDGLIGKLTRAVELHSKASPRASRHQQREQRRQASASAA